MRETEKIRRYIGRTGKQVEDQARYAINMREILDLMRSSKEYPIEAIVLTFGYGKANGYRATKAERSTEV